MDGEEDLVKGLRSGVWAWWDFPGMGKLFFVDDREDVLADIVSVLPQEVIIESLEGTVKKE